MTIMSIGYERPLYLLPFDQRGTFQNNIIDWTGELTDAQTAKIAAANRALAAQGSNV